MTITRAIVDDIMRSREATAAERHKVIEQQLPVFLGAVEKHLSASVTVPREITLTMDGFPPGTL